MDERDLAELAEFLKAQIDEDERIAVAASGKGGPDWPDSDDEMWTNELVHARRHDPARVLREVEAKRVRIVVCADALAANQPQVGQGDERSHLYNEGVRIGSRVLAEAMLQAEALPYSDRSGYKEGWRP